MKSFCDKANIGMVEKDVFSAVLFRCVFYVEE